MALTKAQKEAREAEAAGRERMRRDAARKQAKAVMTRNRRRLKPPAKDGIAEGWWTGLAADIEAAILAGC